MPSLATHPSSEFVKGLYMGKPGSGKTGSLDGLVAAGYKLFIYDFDNLLGTLFQYVMKNNPDKVGNVLYQTFTDKMKGTSNPGMMKGKDFQIVPQTDGPPKAFTNALQQLNRWNTKDDGDLGPPGDFGKDAVVVLDSMTSMAMAAYRWAYGMNPSAMDGRQYYKNAQDLVMNVLYLLFSEQFKTNVLVLAHIDFRENELEVVKGFPRTIGGALGDKPNSCFNSVLMAESTGTGTSIKRVIRTNSTGIIDLKNPVSFKVPDQLPLETGLATFFKAVTNYSPLEK